MTTGSRVAYRVTWWQVLSLGVGRRLSVIRSAMAWRGHPPTLADVDEHMLRDIGLTRMDTWHAGTGHAGAVPVEPPRLVLPGAAAVDITA